MEAKVSSGDLEVMLSHMERDTLVVGAALPGHKVESNLSKCTKTVNLNGLTCPWNTLALWDASKLSLTGFLMVSDGVHDGVEGGVEEAAAIEVLQMLKEQSMKAKVIVGLESVEVRIRPVVECG